jgi:lipopolysaccharide transport system permease protein
MHDDRLDRARAVAQAAAPDRIDDVPDAKTVGRERAREIARLAFRTSDAAAALEVEPGRARSEDRDVCSVAPRHRAVLYAGVVRSAEELESAGPAALLEHQAGAPPLTVIQPTRGWISVGLRDLWAYRELFFFLVWRDIKVRYKQTVIGALWAILQPVLTMIVFSLIFGRAAGLSSDGYPYPVFVFAALLPWQLFSTALTQSSTSIVVNKQLVTKVYFPRLIIPLASTLSGIVDFLMSFVVLIGLMAYYRIVPPIWVITLPLFVILAIATALAAGLWLTALNARYRDVQYTVPLLMQLWFFLTPVVYSTSILPGNFEFLYGLNPMVGVVQGFRWALLGSAAHIGALTILGFAMTFVLLVSGAAYFRRTEKVFADLV